MVTEQISEQILIPSLQLPSGIDCWRRYWTVYCGSNVQFPLLVLIDQIEIMFFAILERYAGLFKVQGVWGSENNFGIFLENKDLDFFPPLNVFWYLEIIVLN